MRNCPRLCGQARHPALHSGPSSAVCDLIKGFASLLRFSLARSLLRPSRRNCGKFIRSHMHLALPSAQADKSFNQLEENGAWYMRSLFAWRSDYSENVFCSAPPPPPVDTKTRVRRRPPAGRRGFFCVIFAFDEIFAPVWENSQQLFCAAINFCVRSEGFFPLFSLAFQENVTNLTIYRVVSVFRSGKLFIPMLAILL